MAQAPQREPSIGPNPQAGVLERDTVIQFPDGTQAPYPAGTPHAVIQARWAELQRGPQPLLPSGGSPIPQEVGAPKLPINLSDNEVISTLANLAKVAVSLPNYRTTFPTMLGQAAFRTGMVGGLGALEGGLRSDTTALDQATADTSMQGLMEGVSYGAPRLFNRLALRAGGYSGNMDEALEAFEDFNRSEPHFRPQPVPGIKQRVPLPTRYMPIGSDRAMEARKFYSDRVGQLVDQSPATMPGDEMLGATDDLMERAKSTTHAIPNRRALVDEEQALIDNQLALRNATGGVDDEEKILEQLRKVMSPADRADEFGRTQFSMREAQDMKLTQADQGRNTIKARKLGNRVSPEDHLVEGQYPANLAGQINKGISMRVPGYEQANDQLSNLFEMLKTNKALRQAGPSTLPIRMATGFGLNESASFMAGRDEDNPLVDRRLAMILAAIGLHPSNLSRAGNMIGRGTYAAGQATRLTGNSPGAAVRKVNAATQPVADFSAQDLLRALESIMGPPQRTGR